jgi:hypothetical protein
MPLLRSIHRLTIEAHTAVLALAVVLTLAVSVATAKATPGAAPPPPPADDAQGELIGDLVFHADLLSALDRLCPQRDAADWHSALRPLLDQAFTPELRELSRRLGADAGAQVVQERGGCRTRGFAAAYDESKSEYRALLQRWRSGEAQ